MIDSRLTIRLFLLAFTACALAASGQNEPTRTLLDDYQLGPRDQVDVHVLEVPELNVERRVTDAGVIDLPLIGQFPVSGLTAQQAKERLQTLLQSKGVNAATVSITIKDYANKTVSVIGAVQRPGPLPISGHSDLLQAISAAGGLAPNAGRKIYVVRRAASGLSDTLEIKSDDLLRDAAQWNISIFPSDIINVAPRVVVRIFCVGEVKNPGAIEMDADDRITLLTVIAKAGGLTDRASNGMRIKRKNEHTGKDEEIVVNYRLIVGGKQSDPVLRADDVVIVGSSFF
jgi:polysaccharide export outer membrane protein